MIASIKTRLPILMAITAIGLLPTLGQAAEPAPAPRDAGDRPARLPDLAAPRRG
jgi:hypothetical protein